MGCQVGMRSHMVYSPTTVPWLSLMDPTTQNKHGHTHTCTCRNWQLKGMLSFSTGATEVCQNEAARLSSELMLVPQYWQCQGCQISLRQTHKTHMCTYTHGKKKAGKQAIQNVLSDTMTISCYSANSDKIHSTSI